MEKLLRERHELHRNLGACTSFSRQQHDSEDTQSLQILLKQRDIVEEELEKEKQSQNELQKEVDRVLFLISSPPMSGHMNPPGWSRQTRHHSFTHRLGAFVR